MSEKTPSSNNTTDDSTHGHHQMVNTEIRLIIFFVAKDGEALYSPKIKDQELTVAQFRYKLEKAGKTTRPFRYDLNQFSYNYTVEVTNIFKGLDLLDRVPEELWMEVWDTVQESVFNTITKKKKSKR